MFNQIIGPLMALPLIRLVAEYAESEPVIRLKLLAAGNTIHDD
jgi:hypothetical protein